MKLNTLFLFAKAVMCVPGCHLPESSPYENIEGRRCTKLSIAAFAG